MERVGHRADEWEHDEDDFESPEAELLSWMDGDHKRRQGFPWLGVALLLAIMVALGCLGVIIYVVLR